MNSYEVTITYKDREEFVKKISRTEISISAAIVTIAAEFRISTGLSNDDIKMVKARRIYD